MYQVITCAHVLLQIERLSFGDQIDSFNKTKEAMNRKIGIDAAAKLCSEAIFFIGIGIHKIIPVVCFFCLLIPTGNKSRASFSGSNDYVNNYLQPFLADGQQYTHDEFIGLLISTLGEQFMVKLQTIQYIFLRN